MYVCDDDGGSRVTVIAHEQVHVDIYSIYTCYGRPSQSSNRKACVETLSRME